MRANDDSKTPEPPTRIEFSDLFESLVPVFDTDEEYQRFRDDFRDRMEPILKEQRRARAQSWMDIHDRIYFSNDKVRDAG